jgi:hypothetical protein
VEIITVTLEFLHIFYFYYKKLIIFKTEESILLHVARKKSIKETKPSLNRSKAIYRKKIKVLKIRLLL